MECATAQWDSFDFVIVGGGTAGCVLANRLSADPAASVLLLEAGGTADAPAVRMPAAFIALFGTALDWRYRTAPQPELAGRSVAWPRMRALGGCSAMNAMIYIRGAAADYDRWRSEFGADGWDYAAVLPYFVRAERNSTHSGPLHGTDGPQFVEDRRYTHELSHAWVRAAVDAGLPANADFNGAHQTGAGLYQVTCRDGRRWSAVDGYLTPALTRSNLCVRTGALVTRIVLTRGRARGVTYRSDAGEERTAYADAEVILAAGAIGSAQVLLLSGVGPPAQLRSLGIEVAAALPGVGDNLQDHPVTPLVWHTRDTTDLRLDLATARNALTWHSSGTGPLSSNVAEAGGFLRADGSGGPPDIQVHLTPTAFYDIEGPRHDRPTVTAGVTLVDVRSTGRLRLRSADPRAHPILRPGYLTDGDDLAAVLAGCRRVLDICARPAFARYLHRPHLLDTATPTNTQLREHIRTRTRTLFHPVGTCAMGRHPLAVVDPSLRVHGIEGLRIADASVMPRIVRGNTNAPVQMIAERAADLVLAEAIRSSQ
ncbi:GMC family oxidoreductase [Nocardia sp. NPDC003482]